MTSVWGLTGGIGAGKSTVARLLKERGVEVLDADHIAHEISRPGGAAHAALLREFGTADRTELAQKVFADPTARKKIESLLHPLIATESDRQIAAIRARPNPPLLIMYEAALLFEAGRDQDFDGVLVVVAPEDQRLARASARDSASLADIRARMAAQMSDAERRKRATRVLENNGTEAQLAHSVEQWLSELGLANESIPP